MNERTEKLVALLSFTGEEGFKRRGEHFLASKSRAEFLCNPVKGERQALARKLYDTATKNAPVVETKKKSKKKKVFAEKIEIKTKKKRTKKEKGK